jgi:peptide/nickel transport system permease protein
MTPPVGVTSAAVDTGQPHGGAEAWPSASSGIARRAGGTIPGEVAAPVPQRRRRSWAVIGAAAWLVGLTLLAVFADVLPLRAPDAISSTLSQPPGARWPEFLGTDDLGRSMLSRIVFGARVSLTIGLGATTGGLIVGTTFGMVAGYLRRGADDVIDTVMTALLAFPPLILLLALASVLSPNLRTLSFALGLVSVPMFYRLARASTISITEREYVLSARSMGASHRWLLVRELLPNVILPVASFAIVFAALIIVAEGSLSFLGLGIRPPQPSWGGMVATGQESMDDHPHLVFVPAVAFIATVLSLNVVGDWARARFSRGGVVE